MTYSRVPFNDLSPHWLTRQEDHESTQWKRKSQRRCCSCKQGCVAGGPSPCPLCLLFWHPHCSLKLIQGLEKRTTRIPHLDDSLEQLLNVVNSAMEPFVKLPAWIISVLDGDGTWDRDSDRQAATAHAAPATSSTSSSRPPSSSRSLVSGFRESRTRWNYNHTYQYHINWHKESERQIENIYIDLAGSSTWNVETC